MEVEDPVDGGGDDVPGGAGDDAVQVLKMSTHRKLFSL